MAKLSRQFYYNADGERKINCYKIHIPKIIIDRLNFKISDEFIITTRGKEIIIKKK